MESVPMETPMSEEEEDDEPGNPEEEAIEVPEPDTTTENEAKPVKPKRVIKNPLPKLDERRLMGPRGVGIILSTFKDIKFKGKGHEKEDLTMLMKKLEHWSHRLFPKLPFDDNIKQIEKLGSKSSVKNMMKRIRLDMFQSNDIQGMENADENRDGDPEKSSTTTREVDVFDELLGTGPFAPKEPKSLGDHDLSGVAASSEPTLSEEQRERMERNKRLALERRNAKLRDQQKKETNTESTTVAPSQESSPDYPQNFPDSNSVAEGNDVDGSEELSTYPSQGLRTEFDYSENRNFEKVSKSSTNDNVENKYINSLKRKRDQDEVPLKSIPITDAVLSTKENPASDEYSNSQENSTSSEYSNKENLASTEYSNNKENIALDEYSNNKENSASLEYSSSNVNNLTSPMKIDYLKQGSKMSDCKDNTVDGDKKQEEINDYSRKEEAGEKESTSLAEDLPNSSLADDKSDEVGKSCDSFDNSNGPANMEHDVVSEDDVLNLISVEQNS